jgi:hypothetical protein
MRPPTPGYEACDQIPDPNPRTRATRSRFINQMGIDVLSPVEQARGSGPAPLPPPAAAEQPVFTDPDGRRARVVTLAGRALVCLLLLWLIAVAAGIAGLGTLPGVPDLGGSTATGAERPGSKVAGAPSTAGQGVMPGAGDPAADRSRDGEAAFGTAGGRGGSEAGEGSARDRSFLRGGSGDAPPRGRGEPPSPPRSRVLARRESALSRDRPAVPPPAAQQAPSAQGAPAPPEGRPQNAPAAERAPGRPEAPPSPPAKGPSARQGSPAGAPAAPGPPPSPPGQSRTTSAPQPAPAPGAPARGGGGPPPHAQASPSSP